jgi:hypothetical protein
MLSLAGTAAMAHHGWRWTAEGKFELTGKVTEARLGNPHGVLTVTANGESWIVEVGQPWRNDRAGLTDVMLAPGAEITILGSRAADPGDLKLKAEAVTIAGTQYVLYPDRM